MGTVKSEQAKGLTLERRRRKRQEEEMMMMMMMMMMVVVMMMMCRPTYGYQGLNDDSTTIACSFVQVPSFQRNPLPLSS
jgi:type III secretory pathway component EscV